MKVHCSNPKVALTSEFESNFRVAAVYFRVAAAFGLRALQRVRQRWWLLVVRLI